MTFLSHPSPAFVDAVINHPTVRGTFERGALPLRSAGLLGQPDNWAVADPDGAVALFLGRGAGVYQGHIATISGSRGAKALVFGRRALTWLFTDCGASKLEAAVPAILPAARTYCRRLGLKPEGRDLFNEYFSMEAGQWAV